MMIKIVLLHPEDPLRWSFNMHEMESPDSSPEVQCNIDAIGQQSTLSITALRSSPMSSSFLVDKESNLSWVSGSMRVIGWAGPYTVYCLHSDPRVVIPDISVITSSNSRKQGQSPSLQVWDLRPSRVAHPDTSASSNTHLPTTPTLYHLKLAFFGIALHCTDITANYSINSKINDNNKNTVKSRLDLGKINYIEHKGIKYLIYNISLILCVPQFIKNNYSNVNAIISKLKQRNYEVVEMMINTKKNGAFPQIQENKSQCFKKIICDLKLIIKCILINQNFGHAPDNSIPVLKNAITVQGIVYGHPHSHSFNPNLIYSGGVAYPLSMNKSDYAFIDKTRIIIHSVLNESETVSRKLLVYLKLTKENKMPGNSKVQINNNDFPYFTKKSNMLCKSLGYSDVDNNYPEGEVDDDGAVEDAPADCDKAERIDDKKVEYATFGNGEFTFKSLLKMVAEAPVKIARLVKEQGPQALNAWNIPKCLRLAGGGESSLNAASGWGSPPNANNNNGVGNNWGGNNGGSSQPTAANNIQQQWASANQRPPTSQDANTNKVNNVSTSGTGSSSVVSPSGPTGNWGSTSSNSNMPVSSQSNNSSQPMPPVQAGTGGNNSPGANGNGAPPMPPNNTVGPAPGAVPPPTNSKAQLEQLSTMREALFSQDGWGGHVNQDTNWDVPTSPEPGVKLDQTGGPPVWKPNINNGTDLWEANLRNGGQPPPQPVAKTPWGHTPTTNIGGTWGEDDDAPDSSNVWTGPPPPQQWGAPPHQPPHWNAAGKKDDWVGWGEPHRPDIHRPDMHGRDLRAPAPDHRDMRTMMNMDGRGGDMRGDPRGISGRLNGGDMWGQHHGMPHGMQAPNKMMPTNVGNGVNQWGAQAPKDMNMPKGGSGWEEPSPPAARRNMSNFDDGTSLWGQQRGSGVGVAPWKEMSGGMGRGAMQCPPVMPPNRMPGVAPNPMKPDAMWGHPHRNGSWEESSTHSGNWEKDGGNSWNDSSMNQGSGWIGQKTKPMGAPGGSWDSDMGDWGGPKPPGGGGSTAKLLPKDMIWNSKQFRLLVDMGYKKDDVELALRNRDMNVDDAMDLLAQMRGTGGMDTWRRLEDHPGGPPFDHQQQYPAPPRHQPPSFPPPQQPPSVPFPQPSQGLVSNISPAIPKILSQPTSQPPPPFNQQNNQSGGSGQPSTAQLRMLVQQIQMAVTAGYLNHQILNQPLAPQTLVLLNQLLQQIKLLQQLGSQHNAVMQNSMGGKNSSTMNLHITVQITKAKQQIVNLQGQIAAQQAIYIKQQGNAGGGSSSGTGDFFNKPQDPLAPLPQLQNNFADLSLNKDAPTPYGGNSGQQSRLNQWKLPSLDKDEGSEFSRAPGTTTKSTTSPQLNPLALQPDSTWSTGRSVNDGWPSSDTSDLPDGKEPWPTSQPPQSATYTDLVPEFEPGKPWKGNQMKSIEDDPAITPGSVQRSPLSLAAIKDTDIFGTSNQSKASPTTPSERSLSSSTWSYPPPSSTPNSFNIAKGGGSKSSWGDTAATGPSELWGSGSSMSKSRGPLPTSSSKPTPSWGGSSSQPQRSAFSQPQNWQSTWLLLKNLTAQIDGSTLKTLCVQHGPLQSFHLYLNQGIALSKYNTREEASKAQTALNNCVLGNTTIFAETPAESDVNMILQHLGQGAGGSQWRNSGGKGASGPPASDTWNFTALWDTPLAEQRATPSSLTTFLPPDLLGGESI